VRQQTLSIHHTKCHGLALMVPSEYGICKPGSTVQPVYSAVTS